jgi:hypothetical protein
LKKTNVSTPIRNNIISKPCIHIFISAFFEGIHKSLPKVISMHLSEC